MSFDSVNHEVENGILSFQREINRLRRVLHEIGSSAPHAHMDVTKNPELVKWICETCRKASVGAYPPEDVAFEGKHSLGVFASSGVNIDALTIDGAEIVLEGEHSKTVTGRRYPSGDKFDPVSGLYAKAIDAPLPQPDAEPVMGQLTRVAADSRFAPLAGPDRNGDYFVRNPYVHCHKAVHLEHEPANDPLSVGVVPTLEEGRKDSNPDTNQSDANDALRHMVESLKPIVAHVVAWHFDGGAGFDWYRDAEKAKVPYDVVQRVAKDFADHGYKAYRFDVQFRAGTSDDDITAAIDENLDYWCEKSIVIPGLVRVFCVVDAPDLHQDLADRLGCSRRDAKMVNFGAAYIPPPTPQNNE